MLRKIGVNMPGLSAVRPAVHFIQIQEVHVELHSSV